MRSTDDIPVLTSEQVDTSDLFMQADKISPEDLFRNIEGMLHSGEHLWISGGLFQELATRMGRGQSVLAFPRKREVQHRIWFRIRDFVISAVALIILSPLLAVIAVLVKLSSAGPVLYSTRVIGVNGQPFTWFKFRSMRVLSPEEDERRRREQFRTFAEQQHGEGPGLREAKVIDETRVTTVGGFLRKYSLDELPQLINVLKGQMSLVGPRPCLPYEAELFPQWARRRFDVRPGLTGVWQVYGRSRVGFEEALAMDVYYVYARSFWLDLQLIIRTIMVVLKGQGGR